jgi:Ca2+-binding EF-hand superfamily protein
LEAIDTNCNGVIDYTEFIAATIPFESFITEGYLRQIFSFFDKDADGFISAGDLSMIIKRYIPRRGQRHLSQVGAISLIQEADGNCDGLIDFYEFSLMMSRSTSI